MEKEILKRFGDAPQLERLYREDKLSFSRSFNLIYEEIKSLPGAAFWHARINYAPAESVNMKGQISMLLAISVLAGILAKLPAILPIDEEFYYSRNASLIVLPALFAYFTSTNRVSLRKTLLLSGCAVLLAAFINFLPNNHQSDTLILACIHLPVILWALLGTVFSNEHAPSSKRLAFLKYKGDLLIMAGLIALAGGLMSLITIGLFSLIKLDIAEFWFENIVLFALPSVPLLATFLIRSNPLIVGKISPLIARIFSPLVLIMLIAYLVAISTSAKDPYNDRQFLLVFNALLIGVLAIIFFSITGTERAYKPTAERWILFLLSIVTITVNVIALSAIIFRIQEWGVTPNRTAVLGLNILVLVHLGIVSLALARALRNASTLPVVGLKIAGYLPLYIVWACIVVFVFPLIFQFR